MMDNHKGEGMFSNLNYGTKPTSVHTEVVVVNVDPALIVNDFGKAYCVEMNRRNPIRFESIHISEEDLTRYFTDLVTMRILYVNGEFKDWRKAKALVIPAWIEYSLTCLGEVLDADYGLKFIPKTEATYDFDFDLMISEKLRLFKSDGMVLLQDAFPREVEGDFDTMSMAVIGDYVYSRNKDSHPIASYVAAYLGLKIKEEAAFKMLYRVRYDDINFIRTMLLHDEKVKA